MFKELLLLPAVLGCSLGGGPSPKNAIDTDNTYVSFIIRIPYGQYVDDHGVVFTFSPTDELTNESDPVLVSGSDEYTCSVDDGYHDLDPVCYSFFLVTDISSQQYLDDPLVFDSLDLGLGLEDREIYFDISVVGNDVIVFDGVLSISMDLLGYDNIAEIPAPPMSGVAIVNEIVSILVGGLVSLGTGIGLGISNFAQALAFSNGQLSVYFILVVAFASVALAVGLTSRLFQWLSSLGN